MGTECLSADSCYCYSTQRAASFKAVQHIGDIDQHIVAAQVCQSTDADPTPTWTSATSSFCFVAGLPSADAGAAVHSACATSGGIVIRACGEQDVVGVQVCQWICRRSRPLAWICPRRTGPLMSMRTAPWCAWEGEDRLAAPDHPAETSELLALPPPPLFPPLPPPLFFVVLCTSKMFLYSTGHPEAVASLYCAFILRLSCTSLHMSANMQCEQDDMQSACIACMSVHSITWPAWQSSLQQPCCHKPQPYTLSVRPSENSSLTL